jgi:hypothetical protein
MPRTGFEPTFPDFKLCKTVYTIALVTTLIPVIVWKIYNLTHVTEAGCDVQQVLARSRVLSMKG